MLVPWFLLIGALLVAMAFAARYVDRLPLTSAVLYLGVGVAIGPWGANLLHIGSPASFRVVETLAEIAVLVSLFAVGLRLRARLTWPAWRVPVMLAGPGMIAGIALAMLAAHAILGLPVPIALLVGAILAPTDPVLASDVQVRHAGDRDTVRFSLTAEGGMNDGSAFPAVMLALGWMGLHELGPYAARWFTLDVVWAIGAGLAIGWLCGVALGRILGALRSRTGTFEFEEFLALGVIALAYGVALACAAYGFLAVFAAGLAFRHLELAKSIEAGPEAAEEAARPQQEIASRLLVFTQQMERIAEVAVVLIAGALLANVTWSWPLALFVAAMLLLVRPLTVLVAAGPLLARKERRLVMWFGIRGVGSIYYLAYALDHGLSKETGETLIGITAAVVSTSVVVHGISATPLMERYHARRERRGGKR